MRPLVYTLPEAIESKPLLHRPIVRRLAGALIGLAVLAIIGIGLLALNWPFTERALVDALQESSVRSVTIDRFHTTYFPPGCIAEGVSFLHRKRKDQPPLITIQRLTIQGSYAQMLTLRREVQLARLEGMHVTVPPKGVDGSPNPIMPLTQTKSGPQTKIGTVIADGTVLDFIPTHSGRPPFHLLVHKLWLDGVGKDRPISYRATIFNPKPPGEIQSTGRFGPWNPDEPGRTAVAGSYTFRNANLAFFKTISGTLFSSGNFSGTLDHIEIAGTTDTPNFQISGTSHTRRLATEFHADIDATDGNTSLENVIGHFDRTTIACTGRVAGEDGRITSLDIFGSNGRIDDLLNLFISSKRPPMTGSVSFRAHVEAQPQSPAFIKTLKLHGDFGVGSGKFTNPGTQDSVAKLSESAEKWERPENPTTVLSDLKGHVVVRDGVATLSNLSFSVPGASAHMDGTYSLIDYKVDLHGTLMTRGKISDATSGFRSILVKAIAPLFRKRASLKIVPFKITGSYQHATVSLDMGAKKSRARRRAAHFRR